MRWPFLLKKILRRNRWGGTQHLATTKEFTTPSSTDGDDFIYNLLMSGCDIPPHATSDCMSRASDCVVSVPPTAWWMRPTLLEGNLCACWCHQTPSNGLSTRNVGILNDHYWCTSLPGTRSAWDQIRVVCPNPSLYNRSFVELCVWEPIFNSDIIHHTIYTLPPSSYIAVCQWTL